MEREIVEQDGRWLPAIFTASSRILAARTRQCFKLPIMAGGIGDSQLYRHPDRHYLNTHCSHVKLCKTAHFRGVDRRAERSRTNITAPR
jgi:hypothetical protein